MKTSRSPKRPPRQHYPDRETQNEWLIRFRLLAEKPSPQSHKVSKSLQHFFSINLNIVGFLFVILVSQRQSHGFAFNLFLFDHHRFKSSFSTILRLRLFSVVYFPSDDPSSASSVSEPRRKSHFLLSVVYHSLSINLKPF